MKKKLFLCAEPQHKRDHGHTVTRRAASRQGLDHGLSGAFARLDAAVEAGAEG